MVADQSVRISFLIVGGMVALFLIFAIYGIVTFDLSIQEMKKLLSTRNEAIAFNMIQDIDQRVENRISNMRQLTKISEVQEALKESNNSFSQLQDVNRYLADKELEIEFEGQSEIPAYMAEVVNQKLSKEFKSIIEFYRDEYNFDVVKELFVTNAYGANVALGSGISDYIQNDEEWWQKSKEQGFFYEPVEYNENYQASVIAFGFRVDDMEGNFLGVLRVLVSLEDILTDFMEETDIVNNQNRNVILLDDDGEVIFSRERQDYTGIDPELYFYRINIGKDIGVLELEDEVDNIRFLSYAKSTGYKTFEGFDWVVIVEQDSSSIVDEFVDLRNSILTISVIGMIIAIIVGLTISKFVSNPLKDLSKMSDSISKGDFKIKPKASSITELNTIGKSFEKMAKSLEQLIETEKKLAEANVRVKNERFTAIGELAANIAHDLKNPLATIRSTADIVKRSSVGKDKELDEILARMNRAIARMSHQIEGVLNFVRITPVNLSKVSVNSLLETAVDSLEVSKNITINFPEKTVELICDPKKMEIVFINLILNAVQAIGKEQGSITIRLKEDENFQIIEFENSGSEIPEEIIPKIFEPLFTTKEKGTGLGLSSCKNIVEQHNGTISAKNNPTTFTIKLPKNPQLD